jgi:exodeoxyribonuclease VII large subunit
MARLPRLTVPGYPHRVFQRGNNRQAIFGTDEDRRFMLETLATRLWRENPRHRLEALCARAAQLRQRLSAAAAVKLGALEQRLALASRTLDAVSPLATLGRGFAVVSRVDDGRLLRDAQDAPAGTEIEARLARGSVRARVTGPGKGSDD